MKNLPSLCWGRSSVNYSLNSFHAPSETYKCFQRIFTSNLFTNICQTHLKREAKFVSEEQFLAREPQPSLSCLAGAGGEGGVGREIKKQAKKEKGRGGREGERGKASVNHSLQLWLWSSR